MKKYANYNVIAADGIINAHFDNYREAFSIYQKCEKPKTLYGYTSQGDVEVIMCK